MVDAARLRPLLAGQLRAAHIGFEVSTSVSWTAQKPPLCVECLRPCKVAALHRQIDRNVEFQISQPDRQATTIHKWTSIGESRLLRGDWKSAEKEYFCPVCNTADTISAQYRKICAYQGMQEGTVHKFFFLLFFLPDFFFPCNFSFFLLNYFKHVYISPSSTFCPRFTVATAAPQSGAVRTETQSDASGEELSSKKTDGPNPTRPRGSRPRTRSAVRASVAPAGLPDPPMLPAAPNRPRTVNVRVMEAMRSAAYAQFEQTETRQTQGGGAGTRD
jgi:hypothetical protein